MKELYQVGDKIKMSRLTKNFMKGESYPVSHVFHKNNKIYTFVKDKKGYDVPLDKVPADINNHISYLETNKYKILTMVDFMQYYNMFDRKTQQRAYYSISEINMMSGEGHFSYAIQKFTDGVIHKKLVHSLSDHGQETHYFKTRQDVIDFMNKDLSQYKEPSLFLPQEEDSLNKMLTAVYISENKIPELDPSVLFLAPEESYSYFNNLISDLSIDEFKELYSDVFYNCTADEMSLEAQQLYNIIIEAYILLPKSYGPTSVSKLLTGKKVKLMENSKHLHGITSLKQERVFLMADTIETFLYKNNIFSTNISGEDIGVYEFISSKHIDMSRINSVKF